MAEFEAQDWEPLIPVNCSNARGRIGDDYSGSAWIEGARWSHLDHLEDRARTLGPRWVALWQRLYGHAMAASQQALSGLIDRSQGYNHALINERVPTRLGDGSVDVEVEGNFVAPSTGKQIFAAVRAQFTEVLRAKSF